MHDEGQPADVLVWGDTSCDLCCGLLHRIFRLMVALMR
jgi:hypothetical protein